MVYERALVLAQSENVVVGCTGKIGSLAAYASDDNQRRIIIIIA